MSGSQHKTPAEEVKHIAPDGIAYTYAQFAIFWRKPWEAWMMWKLTPEKAFEETNRECNKCGEMSYAGKGECLNLRCRRNLRSARSAYPCFGCGHIMWQKHCINPECVGS